MQKGRETKNRSEENVGYSDFPITAMIEKKIHLIYACGGDWRLYIKYID